MGSVLTQVSGRTELNCRTPGCHRELLGVGENPQISSVTSVVSVVGSMKAKEKLMREGEVFLYSCPF